MLMNPNLLLFPLATVTDRFSYISPYKVLAAVILLYLWALAVVWVDRDTDTVKTKREQWNVIVLASGIVGWLALFIPPWFGILFIAGFGFWFLLAGGSIIAYVLHRNGRVVPDARVCTPGHVTRLLSGGGRTKKIKDKGQRVRLYDHKEKFIERPDDPEGVYEYDAMQDFAYDILWRRASDVDMIAGKEKYRVVFKIDGVPSEVPEGIPVEDGERIFRFLKLHAGLNVEEIRRPQSGKVKMEMLSQDDSEWSEIATSGTTAGERLRIRLAAGAKLMRIHELGFDEARLERLREVIAKPTGMVIVSAPPQHGMTTTQYAILKSHDAFIQNMHTLETKRMLDLDNITQQVYDHSTTEASYARTLQSVLRREPDVVMVSICDDKDTAQVAARAAADDRKIYMGIHASDSFSALAKCAKMVEDNQLTAKALTAIVNQRLMRILCNDCREAFKPDAGTLKKLNLPADKIEMFHRPPAEPLVDKRGNEIICPTCQSTGYVGRVGVFEILVVDDAIRKFIAEGASLSLIKSQCRKNKMYYLQEEALLKVIDGTTSLQEVLRTLRTEGKK